MENKPQNIPNNHILFIDLETVPSYPTFEEMPAEAQSLWTDKSRLFHRNSDESPEQLYERAGIYAEFGKIICISVGLLRPGKNSEQLHLHSFYGDDEKILLLAFANMLRQWEKPDKVLCGHNIREFDVPYICRRMLIHGVELPILLQLNGLKPWEVRHLDTLQFWKFGDYKNFTSLRLLAWCFGIPSPKDDIDGSEVAQVYYKERNLPRIVRYCERDVVTVCRLWLKLMGRVDIDAGDTVVHDKVE
jgi:3'-5' exonuclease